MKISEGTDRTSDAPQENDCLRCSLVNLELLFYKKTRNMQEALWYQNNRWIKRSALNKEEANNTAARYYKPTFLRLRSQINILKDAIVPARELERSPKINGRTGYGNSQDMELVTTAIIN